MKQVFGQKSFLVVGLPLAVATLTIALLFGALFLSAAKSDQAAIHRQQDLLNFVVANLEEEVAHNQESATVWDDAVVEVRERNGEWMASNLGEWMHSYFRHDAALVIDARDGLVYEFIADPSNSASGAEIAKLAAPWWLGSSSASLRANLRPGQLYCRSARVISSISTAALQS